MRNSFPHGLPAGSEGYRETTSAGIGSRAYRHAARYRARVERLCQAADARMRNVHA